MPDKPKRRLMPSVDIGTEARRRRSALVSGVVSSAGDVDKVSYPGTTRTRTTTLGQPKTYSAYDPYMRAAVFIEDKLSNVRRRRRD